MRSNWSTWTLCWALLWAACVLADEATNTTQKAVPAQDSTQPPVTTTPKPKINIANSAICKKCSCDVDVKLLDCSNRSLTAWFDESEWQLLQNGDVLFDTIKLDHNKLTEVPQLPAYPVQKLYLGYNVIAKLALSAFVNTSSLTTLDLSHNKINSKVLLPDVFRSTYSSNYYLPLDKLLELDLGYNELHTLNQNLFEHTPKLEVLVLGGNSFQVIDKLTETAIAGLASLKTLDMSYMELQELPDHLLHGPRDLQTLILTGNLFDELPDDLELAINLKELVLDENPITDLIDDNVFHKVRSLEYLSMSYMPDLTTIGEGAFSNLPKLNTLIAFNNPKLSHIDAKAFAIPTTNPEYFDYPPLEKLYLHNNNLTVFNRDWLVRWDKVSTIDLRLNPWICDCSNSWLIHSLMTQINGTTPMLTQDVECGTPEAWKAMPLMDLNSHKTTLVCNTNHPENDSMIVLGLFVGILIGVPLTLASLFLYRRGCFGLVNRSSGNSRPLYNRASFSDDFHI